MTTQTLTIQLGARITAGDYLARVRDPEPPALGYALRSVAVDADPSGSVIEAVLQWESDSPPPLPAAFDAGLPVTSDVLEVRARQRVFA